MKLILSCFLIVTLILTSIVADREDANQDVLNNLLSRLGSHTNNNSDNLVFMPPTFSVDIVSLLRWAVENTPQKKNCRSELQPAPTGSFGNSLAQSSGSEYFYPKDLLELVEFEGKSYFFSRNQKMTWVDAMKYCRAFDMDIVSVETASEDNFLVKQIETIGLKGHYVWMSGNKIGRSTMMWINGEQIIYQNWKPGEPNLPSIEHCMMFYQSQWHDLSCQYEAYFICEQRA